jgi:hypothetical protein
MREDLQFRSAEGGAVMGASGRRRVLVALPIDPRASWPIAAANFRAFLKAPEISTGTGAEAQLSSTPCRGPGRMFTHSFGEQGDFDRLCSVGPQSPAGDRHHRSQPVHHCDSAAERGGVTLASGSREVPAESHPQ